MKAYEMIRILDLLLIGDFSLSGEMIVIVVLVVVIVILLVGVATAAYVREWSRQRVQKEDKDREIVLAIQSMHAVMQTVCERVQSRVDIDRDHHQQLLNEVREVRELGTLVLDVEKRLTGQLEETRRMMRIPKRDGTKIYNTNADGGQTNQGGSVHGEQR